MGAAAEGQHYGHSYAIGLEFGEGPNPVANAHGGVTRPMASALHPVAKPAPVPAQMPTGQGRPPHGYTALP